MYFYVVGQSPLGASSFSSDILCLVSCDLAQPDSWSLCLVGEWSIPQQGRRLRPGLHCTLQSTGVGQSKDRYIDRSIDSSVLRACNHQSTSCKNSSHQDHQLAQRTEPNSDQQLMARRTYPRTYVHILRGKVWGAIRSIGSPVRVRASTDRGLDRHVAVDRSMDRSLGLRELGVERRNKIDHADGAQDVGVMFMLSVREENCSVCRCVPLVGVRA
jgi:hypothetical protein